MQIVTKHLKQRDYTKEMQALKGANEQLEKIKQSRIDRSNRLQDNIDKAIDTEFMNEYYKIQEAQEKSLQSALTHGTGVTRLNYLDGKFVFEHVKTEDFYKNL